MDQQLASSNVPEQPLITSYWPRTQEGGDNIGFGVSRKYMLYTLITSPLRHLFNLLVEPRAIATFPRFLRALIKIIPTILTNRMITQGWKPTLNGKGYFVLDDRGKAHSFLGQEMPESINGRIGVGRKKFLRQLNLS